LKVLLTGASGFVGSHILDSLCAGGIPTAILLRRSSNRRFIESHLPRVEIRAGSVTEPASLPAAVTGITHVIHCAGATKARSGREFFQINQGGTRNLLDALNGQSDPVKRFVHISSLAAAGPSQPNAPLRESDPPHPVSTYGQSKLAAEEELRTRCRTEFVIIRPPAVYGPRDAEFLRLFRAVEHHVLPRPSDTQALSMVFVKDLAEAVVTCLQHQAAAGKTYFVAAREVTTGRRIAEEIAKQTKVWTVPFPLPTAVLWPICLMQDVMTRVTGKPSVLSLEKFAELRAPGWVCDPSLLERETGHACATTLRSGIVQTLEWYRKEGWVRGR
jgi:nucleoside-diphosphate-sugar epimerase